MQAIRFKNINLHILSGHLQEVLTVDIMRGNGSYGISVLSFFSSGISVILILTCGIAVSLSPAVCSFSFFILLPNGI